jgi:hypothetical protein
METETKEVTKVEEKSLMVQKPKAIAMDERGGALPTTLDEQYRLASVFAKSGLVPKSFDSPEKVMVGWQLCADLGLGRSAIKDMWVHNGIPNIHSGLPLSLVRASGRLKSIEEVQFDAKGLAICEKNGNLEADAVSAVCRTTRADTLEVTERSFTLAEAKKAGLLNKDTYKSYLRRMLQMRARAWNLNDAFADVLKGVAILEWSSGLVTSEIGVVVPEIKAPEGAIPKSAADEINSAFGGTPDESEQSEESEQAV